jgi:hypothetical protein
MHMLLTTVTISAHPFPQAITDWSSVWVHTLLFEKQARRLYAEKRGFHSSQS